MFYKYVFFGRSCENMISIATALQSALIRPTCECLLSMTRCSIIKQAVQKHNNDFGACINVLSLFRLLVQIVFFLSVLDIDVKTSDEYFFHID